MKRKDERKKEREKRERKKERIYKIKSINTNKNNPRERNALSAERSVLHLQQTATSRQFRSSLRQWYTGLQIHS